MQVNYSTMNAENPPHFFKIIINEMMLQEKIRIPPKFVMTYGKCLSSAAQLQVRDGIRWEIELSEHDGETSFRKGWKEFSAYHSLNIGHLLVFRYEGGCRFKVLMFDKSGTEIAYPSSSIPIIVPLPNGGSHEPKKYESESEMPVLFFGEMSPCENLRGKSTEVTPLHRRAIGISKPFTSKRNVGEVTHTRPLYSTTDKAVAAANNFNSTYPTFWAVLQGTYLKGSLNVPYSYVEKYMMPVPSAVELMASNGSWTITLISYPDRRLARLSAGWAAFLRDNCVGKGDVCVFELVAPGKMRMTFLRCRS